VRVGFGRDDLAVRTFISVPVGSVLCTSTVTSIANTHLQLHRLCSSWAEAHLEALLSVDSQMAPNSFRHCRVPRWNASNPPEATRQSGRGVPQKSRVTKARTESRPTSVRGSRSQIATTGKDLGMGLVHPSFSWYGLSKSAQ
jgi:hypothetical protein